MAINYGARTRSWIRFGTTGPFKEFLCKINKSNDPFCRYCNLSFENPSHILYDCKRFKDLEFENLEARCIHIVKQLFKDNHLIET